MKTTKPVRISDILLFLLFSSLFGYCILHPEYYHSGSKAKSTLKLQPLRLTAELAVFAAGTALLLLGKRITEHLKKYARPLSIALTLLTPGIAFAFTYFITHSIPKNYSPENYRNLAHSPEIIFWNILTAAMLLLLFLIITNSMRAACSLLVFISIIFCIANYYVCRFRDIPILASDLYSWRTAAAVAGSYSYKPNFACLIALQTGLVYFFAFRCLGNTRLFSLKRRLAFTGAGCIALGIFAKGFLFSDFLQSRGVSFSMFKPLVAYNSNGTYLAVIRSFQYLKIDRPENYSADGAAGIAAGYPSDKATASDDYPNIIIIIDEAFSDLGVVGDLETNTDYMPFIHSLQENTIHGYTYASVLGGGTANSEFEVLTGNSIALLPQNCIAFQVYLKNEMPSLVSACADLGYQGLIAVHPYNASNYGRMTAYPLLGFQTYLSKSDFPKDAPRIRNYISNMAVNDMIIQKYEEAKASSDSPFLFYTMTMQNHSSYRKEPTNLQDTIQLPVHPDAEAQQYLNLIKHSDEAFEELTGYFSQTDDPTVILYLGDHQPNMNTEFLNSITDGEYENWNDEEMMKRYAVPFILWSNYDMPAKEYEKTSMNFLQSILFENCNLPMTGYQKYLLDFAREVPAFTANGYWGADGGFYTKDDTSSPYYETVQEYCSLIYNNLKDIRNRPEGFYELLTD
ncbi:LTA synthase family protein [Marvinbryantia formatexigens]|nr:LTA synthase family protein [Marvinbryantia formatexigens]UWO24909.1 LTA synthase family protein [Marvinbryantia formatexigens DSM 14469]SDH15408.1 Phosphoglycerol transferase MdoB [Marvinbryantia formatexigens]